jgi:predicted RNA-binding Zn-ribbon protein involved in translation (DUF1610 family)
MELEEVKFICPECGEQWVEWQDPEDYWFKLGLRQTLCKNCADKIIKRLKEQWGK